MSLPLHDAPLLGGCVCRMAVLDALSPLGDNVHGGEGAIYRWAKLPAGEESTLRAEVYGLSILIPQAQYTPRPKTPPLMWRWSAGSFRVLC